MFWLKEMPKNKKQKETKICANCKKPFENRKKWKSRNQWESIKYCSERCRREGKKSKKF